MELMWCFLVVTISSAGEASLSSAGQVTQIADEMVNDSLPCISYRLDDELRPSQFLPAVIELWPSYSLPWSVDLKLRTDAGYGAGCVVIEAATTATNVRVGKGSCLEAWQSEASVWPVLPPDLLSVYTLSLFVTYVQLTVTLRGTTNYYVQEKLLTEPKSVYVVGHRGNVDLSFPSWYQEGDCLILNYNCTYVAFTMRLNGSIFLRPSNDSEEPVKMFMKQSKCLDDYMFGELSVSEWVQERETLDEAFSDDYLFDDGSVSEWGRLDLVYTRDDTSHTVSVKLYNSSHSVITNTELHRGRDCTNSWFRIGVTAAAVSLDCDPGKNTATQ
ncbi:hypothetical protein OTU49_006908 [Cherax quadricarinatus]|uniref:Uncharacterized protein n=1 Tax=Cherax quadricarinatus TaxID=27406 RepID=A0AAW0WKW1_CHEQU